MNNSNQLQPQQTPQEYYIDFGSLIEPIFGFIMMMVFMKVMSTMYPEMKTSAPGAKTTSTTTQTPKTTAGESRGLIDNPDWSEPQHVYQQLQLESFGHNLENRTFGIAVEAAGDICRELLGRQYADGAYISEKLTRVMNLSGEKEFKAFLNVHDEDIRRKAVNGYAELEFKTYFGTQAKALIMVVLRQDKTTAQSEVKSMQNEMKKDQRFKIQDSRLK